MEEEFQKVYGKDADNIFSDVTTEEIEDYVIRRIRYSRTRDFDLEAIGIELKGDFVYGILRQKTGDEREFMDLGEGGRVLDIEDPGNFLEGYEDFVSRYNKLLSFDEEIEPMPELEEAYPTGEYGWEV